MPMLDPHDEALVGTLKDAISEAIAAAHKRSQAEKPRTLRGQRRHPFKGICEASGRPLDPKLAVLDELEPELGYDGKLRWVCPKANNSGSYSCGSC